MLLLVAARETMSIPRRHVRVSIQHCEPAGQACVSPISKTPPLTTPPGVRVFVPASRRGEGDFPLPCPSRVCDHHVCAAGTNNAPNHGGGHWSRSWVCKECLDKKFEYSSPMMPSRQYPWASCVVLTNDCEHLSRSPCPVVSPCLCSVSRTRVKKKRGFCNGQDTQGRHSCSLVTPRRRSSCQTICLSKVQKSIT